MEAVLKTYELENLVLGGLGSHHPNAKIASDAAVQLWDKKKHVSALSLSSPVSPRA